MKVLEGSVQPRRVAAVVDWRKGISDNVAFALVVYTALNIFLTVEAIRETGLRSFSMASLVILVTGIVPTCHKFEKRWRALSRDEAEMLALGVEYRWDQLKLWLAALGVPFVLTSIFKALA